MPALETVQDYITESRRLLQDRDAAAYRYSDVELVDALNICLMEARRLRPELFLPKFSIPMFAVTDLTVPVPMDMMYRNAMIYYIVGRMQLRDDEPTQDQRAAGLLQSFMAKLMSLAS
jgi:hypothetical protein